MIKRWLQEGNPRQRINELEAQVEQLIKERDELRKQLEVERTLRMEVIEHRNSLQARLNEAIAPKPKRNSRTKPPATAE